MKNRLCGICGSDLHQIFVDASLDEVARLTGARLYEGRAGNRMLMGGFDAVFDVVGTAATLGPALRWARTGGTVVLVGVHLHRMRLDVTPVWYQEVNLVGSVGHGMVRWRDEAVSTFDLAMRLIADGTLATEGLVTHRFPLESYREAFAAAVDKRAHRSVKVAFLASDQAAFITGQAWAVTGGRELT